MVEPELRELDPRYSARYSNDFDSVFAFDEQNLDDLHDSMRENEEFIDRAYNKHVSKEEKFDGEAYEIAIRRSERDISNLSPEDIGELRDIETELRNDITEKSKEDRARIDAIIDKWNNLNPEFVSLAREFELASSDLDSLYEERNKLRSQLTLEESQYLEDRLVKVEHTIEQRKNEIKMYRERLLPTRTMNDILSDREVTLRDKLR